MPQRNLAVELLQKLLKGEIKPAPTQHRAGALVLRNAGAVAAPLSEPRDRDGQGHRGADPARQGHARGRPRAARRSELTDDEVAFYDALETNDSAVKVLGDDTLRTIARELVATVRANVTIDWTVRENVRAQLRVLVKRILRKYGYPPDKQEKATQTVLEQAEVLSGGGDRLTDN